MKNLPSSFRSRLYIGMPFWGHITLGPSPRSRVDFAQLAKNPSWPQLFRHFGNPLLVLEFQPTKGEAVIVARRRTRVGVNDPDQLAAAIELQKRERKLVGQMVKPLEYEPGSQFSDAKTEGPKAAQVIHPSEFIAAQEAPSPPPEREISSVEYSLERDRYRKPMDFADLED